MTKEGISQYEDWTPDAIIMRDIAIEKLGEPDRIVIKPEKNYIFKKISWIRSVYKTQIYFVVYASGITNVCYNDNVVYRTLISSCNPSDAEKIINAFIYMSEESKNIL